ncbi:PREDICTED: uncharacterized protein LOC106742743 [Dinoponera quadriceps]|uniref:Uncharacterized protein LOC106742743 n=1 Tax=Dinoponera quadriceps TaxID=609295 RepID=A0A6P3X0Q8_DINQU|nr:PREDICTED: uncharacterized protein LOC106742743 [Dinoponera quadriceps]
MFKYAAFFATVFCLANSQRPWHAGSSNRLPMVLPQYLDERLAAEREAQASQAAEAGQALQPKQTIQSLQGASGNQGASASASDVDVLNRNDVIDPADLPVDARGDVDLIKRIKTWPREKQPFWYLNWQAIQAHRGDVNNPAQVPQTQPNTRPLRAVKSGIVLMNPALTRL